MPITLFSREYYLCFAIRSKKNTKRDKLKHNNQNFQQGIKQTQDFLLKIGEQDWFQLLFMCAKYENSTANRTIDVWNLYLWTHFVIFQCFIGKTKRGVHRRRLKTLTTFVLLLIVEHSNLAHAEVVESTVFITFQWNPLNQNFCFITWSVFLLCLSIFCCFLTCWQTCSCWSLSYPQQPTTHRA